MVKFYVLPARLILGFAQMAMLQVVDAITGIGIVLGLDVLMATTMPAILLLDATKGIIMKPAHVVMEVMLSLHPNPDVI
jgi:hypothetical protein